MRIILNEMKKIWNVKLLLTGAIIAGLFYMIFMMNLIDGFKNSHSPIEETEYAMKMTQRYGAMITEEQLLEFLETERQAAILEAEGYIKTLPIFAEVGIYNFEDYEAVHTKEETTEKEHEAVWTLLGEKSNYVRFKLQALDLIENRYYNYIEYTLESALHSAETPARELERLQQIKANEEYRNILDGYSFENTVSYSIYLAVSTILTVLVLVSPLIANDRSAHMHLLQYSSKNGRRILLQQFISVIISAFIVTTLCLLIYGALYSVNGIFVFWNNGLASFLNLNVDIFWFDLSYGQYVVLYSLFLYIVSIGSAALAFVVSRFSRNLISLVMKLIPIFGVIGFTSFAVFDYMFSDSNFFYRFTGIPWLEPIACGLIFVVGLTLSIYVLSREKQIDIL